MTSPLARASSLLADTAPLVRRAVALDPRALVRVRISSGSVASYVRLPFDVLVGRTVAASWPEAPVDAVVSGQDLLAWFDDMGEPPQPQDARWRGAIPPSTGWQRVETVPGTVVREVVRKGAATLREAAEREVVPGAQPRAEVADALLDSVVVTAHAGALRAEVTLRACGALVRMGFLPPDSDVAIDITGRWLRLAAEHGSVYAERAGARLALA